MNEQEAKSIGMKYWREILILLMFIGVLFCYWRWNETKKDLAEAVRISTMTKTRDEINAGTAGVTDRETNVYPKIDTNIGNLNNSIKVVNKELEQLKKNEPKKEKYYGKDNIDELGKWFADNGFDNTTRTSISK